MNGINNWDLLPSRNGDVTIRGDKGGVVARLHKSRAGRMWATSYADGSSGAWYGTRDKALDAIASHLTVKGVTYLSTADVE